MSALGQDLRFGLRQLGRAPGFTATALLTIALGVGASTAHAVKLRRRELGIRLALGARPAALVALVGWQGARLVGLGLVAGLLGALGLTRFLGSLLHRVGRYDPVTFVGIAVLLAATAAAAGLLPARRIGHIDPTSALWAE